jgi:hypothetical protein
MERIRAIAIERGLSLNELSEQMGKGLIPLGMVKKVTNRLVRKGGFTQKNFLSTRYQKFF